jgi:putrescine transport system substrate-binding protein
MAQTISRRPSCTGRRRLRRGCGAALLVIAATGWLGACGGKPEAGAPAAGGPAAPEEHAPRGALNLFFWTDYLAPNTLADFERQTGIKVSASYYDNNETLETRLLTGHSGFDIVVPTGPFFERQIMAGAYQALDKSKLPNLGNMDPQLMEKVAHYDPGNAHGVIYMWGTIGIGYNEQKIRTLLPDAPLDSWRLVFDPAIASKIAPCGIDVLDAPAEMMRSVLAYLGRDPNSQKPEDFAAGAAVLMKIRPYIRNINSSEYVESLANGDLCAAVGFNGGMLQARDRAREAHRGEVIKFLVPQEGSVLWFDILAIPKDAPNPEAAYAFMNYLMNPRVIADVTNYVHFANANAAAAPWVQPAVREDPGVYSPPALQAKLAPFLGDSPEQIRALTRMWQTFKTGQ